MKETRKVVRLSHGHKITGVYESAKEAAESVEISESSIRRACRKGLKAACYYWRYAEKGEFKEEDHE